MFKRTTQLTFIYISNEQLYTVPSVGSGFILSVFNLIYLMGKSHEYKYEIHKYQIERAFSTKLHWLYKLFEISVIL